MTTRTRTTKPKKLSMYVECPVVLLNGVEARF
jgi:hypothetical protein